MCVCKNLPNFSYMPCTGLGARDLVAYKTNSTVEHGEYCVRENIRYRKAYACLGSLLRLPWRRIDLKYEEGQAT